MEPRRIEREEFEKMLKEQLGYELKVQTTTDTENGDGNHKHDVIRLMYSLTRKDLGAAVYILTPVIKDDVSRSQKVYEPNKELFFGYGHTRGKNSEIFVYLPTGLAHLPENPFEKNELGDDERVDIAIDTKVTELLGFSQSGYYVNGVNIPLGGQPIWLMKYANETAEKCNVELDCRVSKFTMHMDIHAENLSEIVENTASRLNVAFNRVNYVVQQELQRLNSLATEATDKFPLPSGLVV